MKKLHATVFIKSSILCARQMPHQIIVGMLVYMYTEYICIYIYKQPYKYIYILLSIYIYINQGMVKSTLREFRTRIDLP